MRVAVKDWNQISAQTNAILVERELKWNFDMREDLVLEAPCHFSNLPRQLVRSGAYTIARFGAELNNVALGRFCSIGPGVTIGAPEHPIDWTGVSSVFARDYDWACAPGKASPIPTHQDGLHIPRTTIGNDVWIGRNAFLKSGITVGDGAVIGAHSVVTKDVAPYTIVAGNPSRVLRLRFDQALIDDLLHVAWWDVDPVWMRKVDIRAPHKVIAHLLRHGRKYPRFAPPTIHFDKGVYLARPQ